MYSTTDAGPRAHASSSVVTTSSTRSGNREEGSGSEDQETVQITEERVLREAWGAACQRAGTPEKVEAG